MKEGTGEMLDAAAEVLGSLEPFTPDAIEGALAPLLDRFDVKPGRLYQPLRVAITGTSVSPGIFESLATLGREQTVCTPAGRFRAPLGRFLNEIPQVSGPRVPNT